MLDKIMALKVIDQACLRGKNVLLRADLNVPIENGQIKDDFKLQALVSTLELVAKFASRCVILTHLGRPEKESSELSTKNLVGWFAENGFNVEFAKTVDEAKNSKSKIIILENLRFFEGEEFLSQEFADQLAELGEFFVFDAFGFIGRKTTSTSLLPKKFDDDKKFIGLLVAKELEAFYQFKSNDLRPYSLLFGGAKLQKLELIEQIIFLNSAQRPNKILIGGFLAAWFYSSFEGIQVRIHFEEICLKRSVSLILPLDFVYFDENGIKRVIRTEKLNWSENQFKFVDIGPESVALFCRVLSESRKLFCNGTMGLFEQNGAEVGTNSVLGTISNVSKNDGIVAAGGGDTLRAICALGLYDSFNFLSSGGGASLTVLGKDFNSWKNLPGISEI